MCVCTHVCVYTYICISICLQADFYRLSAIQALCILACKLNDEQLETYTSTIFQNALIDPSWRVRVAFIKCWDQVCTRFKTSGHKFSNVHTHARTHTPTCTRLHTDTIDAHFPALVDTHTYTYTHTHNTQTHTYMLHTADGVDHESHVCWQCPRYLVYHTRR